MNEEGFITLTLFINYVGIQLITVSNNGNFENKMLLYFSRELDSAEVPLCLTEKAAERLYNDLEKIFQKSN